MIRNLNVLFCMALVLCVAGAGFAELSGEAEGTVAERRPVLERSLLATGAFVGGGWKAGSGQRPPPFPCAESGLDHAGIYD